MKLNYKTLFLLALFAIAGCSLYRAAEFTSKYGESSIVDRQVEALPPGSVSFHDDVQPILEQRCDVCHSCYDAPCQLKMTSFEGIDRGGSKKLVYDSARIKADTPTRLFVDADTTEAWRGMGFHPPSASTIARGRPAWSAGSTASRQLSTSFFASRCLGIPRSPLVAWP